MNPGDNLRQNLDEEGAFSRLYQIYLLFDGEPTRPTTDELARLLADKVGPVDVVADVDHSLTTFAALDHKVEYKDAALPAQLLLGTAGPLAGDRFDPVQRTQFWDCPDAEGLLARCSHELMLSDFLAAGLPYKVRGRLLTHWAETVVEAMPDCLVVFFPTSGKLLRREDFLSNPYEGDLRFLHGGVNVRFFNIEGTRDHLVDSIGLYALGLPDVQYHFHSLDPDAVVSHAYSVLAYLYEQDAPIESGETIAGLGAGGIDPDVKWPCQYERSLIQPVRDVLDVCPGEYAAGGRE